MIYSELWWQLLSLTDGRVNQRKIFQKQFETIYPKNLIRLVYCQRIISKKKCKNPFTPHETVTGHTLHYSGGPFVVTNYLGYRDQVSIFIVY